MTANQRVWFNVGMSLHFTFASINDQGQTYIGLPCHIDHVCPDPANCDDAQMYSPAVCDHADALTAACGCQDYDVSISNVNAVAVFQALGLDFDYVGTMDPDLLLGSALLASAFDHDSMLVTCPLNGPTPAQALPRHFDALVALAQAAKDRGHLIGWS